jgi:alpha-L-fucosidase
MNRREFTGGLAAAALSASLGTTSAGAIVETASELSMLEAQQRFLDLRFGMYIHLNMVTFEQREWGDPRASSALFNPEEPRHRLVGACGPFCRYGVWLPDDQTS